MVVMHRVYGLRISPNFEVQLATDKNFYLRLTVEKMHAYAVLNDKCLQSYGCSDNNSTATIKCTNPKIETKAKLLKGK